MGLPTVAELFDSIFSLEGTVPPGADSLEKEFAHVRTALRFLYPNVDSSKESHAYPPFEEFLSLVHVSADFESKDESLLGFFSEGVWGNYYKAAIKLLSKCFERQSAVIDYRTDSPLKRFASFLTKEDTVITFNWDTILESQLANLGASFTLDPFAEADITILKLHGSLSWVLLGDQVTPKHPEYFTLLSEDDGLFCSKDHSILDTWLPLDRSPYIVTPIAQKRPLDVRHLKILWVNAFDSISQASSMTVIGYSIPDEDYHARALLRDGLCTAQKIGAVPEITLINPDEETGKRFFSTIWPRFDFKRRRFDGTELLATKSGAA